MEKDNTKGDSTSAGVAEEEAVEITAKPERRKFTMEYKLWTPIERDWSETPTPVSFPRPGVLVVTSFPDLDLEVNNLRASSLSQPILKKNRGRVNFQ